MKSGHTSWLVAAAVVAAGGISAMVFQRGPTPPDAAAPRPAATAAQLPGRQEPLQWRLPATAAAAPQPSPLAAIETAPPRRAVTEAMRTGTLPPGDSRQSVPSIESEYGGLLHRFGGAAPRPAEPARSSSTSLSIPASDSHVSPAVMRRPTLSLAQAPAAAETSQARAAPPMQAPLPFGRGRPASEAASDDRDEAPLSRKHRIRDGDTLENLAERYYGDRGLATSLFAWNRQVLPHPELLPVGKEIELPAAPRLGQPRPDAQPRISVGPAAEATASESRTRLVPLQP